MSALAPAVSAGGLPPLSRVSSSVDSSDMSYASALIVLGFPCFIA